MEPRISLITLGVADVARSRRFYEALGWRASGASQESVAFFQLGGLALGLFGRASLAEDAGLAETEPGAPGFGGIALAQNVRSPEAVDALLAEAERAGARILRPARKVFWGGYSGYFADPDGHPWEIAWNPGFAIEADGSLRLPD
jgi:catechol 2,3-dioxygenase-like lactoylglutathione lyase family enzyme